jgi:hypothetical protein
LGNQGLATLVRPHLTLIVLSLLAAIPILLIGSSEPRPAVLPVFSLAATAIAAAVALIAKVRGARWDGDAITLWDIAGAFVLIGCAAAILSKPENLLHWFGQSIVP